MRTTSSSDHALRWPICACTHDQAAQQLSEQRSAVTLLMRRTNMCICRFKWHECSLHLARPTVHVELQRLDHEESRLIYVYSKDRSLHWIVLHSRLCFRCRERFPCMMPGDAVPMCSWNDCISCNSTIYDSMTMSTRLCQLSEHTAP